MQGLFLVERCTRHIRFFDSGLLGERCTVTTSIVECDGRTMVLNHVFTRDRDNKTLTRGVTELGFVGADQQPAAFPAAVLQGPGRPWW